MLSTEQVMEGNSATHKTGFHSTSNPRVTWKWNPPCFIFTCLLARCVFRWLLPQMLLNQELISDVSARLGAHLREKFICRYMRVINSHSYNYQRINILLNKAHRRVRIKFAFWETSLSSSSKKLSFSLSCLPANFTETNCQLWWAKKRKEKKAWN